MPSSGWRPWLLRTPPARLASAGLGLLLLAVAGWFVPTGQYLLLPGAALDVESIISVQDHPFHSSGSLLLVTVYADPANLDTWLFGKFYPEAKLVPREQQLPPGLNPKEYNRVLGEMMDESQTIAKVVALREAGYSVEIRGDGALVQQVQADSTARGQLEPGDIIVAVNGVPITTADELTRAVRGTAAGSELRLDFSLAAHAGRRPSALSPSPTARAGPALGSPWSPITSSTSCP